MWYSAFVPCLMIEVKALCCDCNWHCDLSTIYFPFLGTTENLRQSRSGSDRQADIIQYLSEERSLALQLCGWIKKGADLDVEPFLNSLEQEGDWERAAAVALFNLDIRRAIQILNKGASSGKGVCCVYSFILALYHVGRFFLLTELWKIVWKRCLLYCKIVTWNTYIGAWQILVFHSSDYRMPYCLFKKEHMFQNFLLIKAPERCMFRTSGILFTLMELLGDRVAVCAFHREGSEWRHAIFKFDNKAELSDRMNI